MCGPTFPQLIVKVNTSGPGHFFLQYKSFQHFSREDKVVGKGCSNVSEQMIANPEENKAQQKQGSEGTHSPKPPSCLVARDAEHRRKKASLEPSSLASQAQERLEQIILNFTSS